jgi:hypothetical protein
VTGNATPGDPAGVNDVDGGRTILLSPLFDLNGWSDINISYWRWYTNNLGYNPAQDYWIVEISNDGGKTWTTVENTNVSSNAWEQVEVDFGSYFPVADLVQLRFIAEDLGGGSLVEAAVDDFVLTGLFATSPVNEMGTAVSRPFALEQNQPNPFNPLTEIRFRLGLGGPVRLEVFDPMGRRVRVLSDGSLPAGETRVIWDGRDAGGRPVAAGVYLYRLETPSGSVSKRMVFVE